MIPKVLNGDIIQKQKLKGTQQMARVLVLEGDSVEKYINSFAIASNKCNEILQQSCIKKDTGSQDKQDNSPAGSTILVENDERALKGQPSTTAA